MKTPKKISIKVQRTIETLSKMLIQNAKIIFSMMSITFLSDAGNAIFICIFRKKMIFAFLTEDEFDVCREKKHHLYRIYRKHHIFVYCLNQIIFHFPSRANIIFLRKRNAIVSDDTRKSIFQWDFLERLSFQSI